LGGGIINTDGIAIGINRGSATNRDEVADANCTRKPNDWSVRTGAWHKCSIHLLPIRNIEMHNGGDHPAAGVIYP
jgi:hypothetical protein